MARKSKLTPDQWNEIQKRILNGENIRPIAREYGISESAVRGKLSTQTEQIKTIASQIVATERALSALPINAQINAQNLASKLRSISDNLADAAAFNAMNARLLSSMANAKLSSIPEDEFYNDIDSVKNIAGLTAMANEASKIPLQLLALNKEMMQKSDDVSTTNLKHLSDDELLAIASGSR